jgi:hypothetical protein
MFYLPQKCGDKVIKSPHNLLFAVNKVYIYRKNAVLCIFINEKTGQISPGMRK